MQYWSDVLNKRYKTEDELNDAERAYHEALVKAKEEKEKREALTKALEKEAEDAYKAWKDACDVADKKREEYYALRAKIFEAGKKYARPVSKVEVSEKDMTEDELKSFIDAIFTAASML